MTNPYPASLTKRAMDVLLASIAILILSPLFLLIALCVKLSSKGPVFFSQPRAAYRNGEFNFIKFRSMRIKVKPEIMQEIERLKAEGKLLKMEKDPRVTRIGAFIRKSSLDELPQLFNVLKGEMSLVGPRPLIPFMLDGHDEFAEQRKSVRPGITGLWQIRDRRNNTHVSYMMPHDLEYIQSASFRKDIAIMFSTALMVLTGKDAY